MLDISPLESTAKYGGISIISLLPSFLRYAQFDLNFSPNTIIKYEECLRTIVRHVGDLPVELITIETVTEIKQKASLGGAGEARIGTLIFSLKSFLKYCLEIISLNVLEPKQIKSPKRSRREVVFLSNEEINEFINSIAIKTQEGKPTFLGVRFRTLVEVLLGTGARISEALSLNREDIDFEKREAKIIGKGNKERTLFFNQRSLDWIKYYLSLRIDSNPAIFIASTTGKRMDKVDVSNLFRTARKKLSFNKKLTPHILRHSMATNLLFNGCPISHVKEILGHERLETTCRYYLGLDKRKAKEAHGTYLVF